MIFKKTNHYGSSTIASFIILLSGIPAAHAAFFQNTFGLSDPHSTANSKMKCISLES
jgi:hypothetical protein